MKRSVARLSQNPAWAVGLLVVLVVVFALVFSRPSPASGFSTLPDWHNATGWLNSEPLSWPQLAGKPTVVYFWSGTCERCLGTGMDLARNWSRISGLNWVWVHAPEFAFERDASLGAAEAQTFNLSGPIALDYQSRLWPVYSNHSQDVLYVVAANGTLLYSANHADASLDAPLRLLASGQAASFPRVPLYPVRRIYTGYETAVDGIRQTWQPYQSADYRLPETPLPFMPHLFGSWYVGGDFVRAQTDGRIQILLPDADSVSVVAYAPGAVAVFESNAPLEPDRRGADVVLRDGRTVFFPVQPGLYRVAERLNGTSEFILDVPAGFMLYRFSLDG